MPPAGTALQRLKDAQKARQQGGAAGNSMGILWAAITKEIVQQQFMFHSGHHG
jgi:hypothetical protein